MGADPGWRVLVMLLPRLLCNSRLTRADGFYRPQRLKSAFGLWLPACSAAGTGSGFQELSRRRPPPVTRPVLVHAGDDSGKIRVTRWMTARHSRY